MSTEMFSLIGGNIRALLVFPMKAAEKAEANVRRRLLEKGRRPSPRVPSPRPRSQIETIRNLAEKQTKTWIYSISCKVCGTPSE